MRVRHNEFPIHAEIMRVRPEINVVVHTHPVLPTLLGSSGETIRPMAHAYLGPEYTAAEIEAALQKRGVRYERCASITDVGSDLLAFRLIFRQNFPR